jgi:hypothetical protein
MARGATAAPKPDNRSSGRSNRLAQALCANPSGVIVMQAQSNTQALSKGKLFAAATAVLIGGLLLANGAPRAAGTSFASGASFQAPQARMHDGVDWSRVVAAPVDTGATVGAYER